MKQALTTAPTLAYFDPTKETQLQTDASTLGIGFLLMQKSHQGDSDWELVQAGSRFLSDGRKQVCSNQAGVPGGGVGH